MDFNGERAAIQLEIAYERLKQAHTVQRDTMSSKELGFLMEQ
jgi:hypothetical protein